MPEVAFAGSTYSPATGLVYIFNLIVGTGALTMPAAFSNAGWMISVIIVVSLALMSYLTTTFVIEAMASANAMIHWRTLQRLKKEGSFREEMIPPSSASPETTPLLNEKLGRLAEGPNTEYYEITEKTEFGHMAALFFNRVGVILFYICIIIYLYGDMAIYAAAISKSIRDVACNYRQVGLNTSCGIVYNETDPCFNTPSSISRINMYRIFVIVFLCALGPFVFFNLQKTKYLQIGTTIMRWIAFIIMIVLVSIRLAKGEGQGHPVAASVANVPNLFGVCVYSFMCHHSLPSMVTPINDKKRLFSLIAGDYVLILFFYCLLSFTGIFAFSKIQDLYTLNFQPTTCHSADAITNVAVIQYFLALFPVFTLSSNFPIIGITLRNNIKSLFQRERRHFSWFVDRIVFPLAAILPPTVLALATNSLELLVGFTGSYAGSMIQYVIPAALVYYSRKETMSALGLGVKNKHASPFRHKGWVYFILIWALICLIFVTYNHIDSHK